MDNIKKLLSPKLVFIILGVIVLVELIYAVRVLTLPAAPPLPTARPVEKMPTGKISLISPKLSFKVKEIVPVSVIIDTGSRSLGGTDLIVSFDPKTLEASAAGLVKGSIFDEYPLVAVDTGAGLISISGIKVSQNGFKGTGQFASINLRAKAPGKTSLIVDFKAGSTTDSNLVETGTSKDILEGVDNLELEIK